MQAVENSSAPASSPKHKCGAALQVCAGPPGPAACEQAGVDAGRRTRVLPHELRILLGTEKVCGIRFRIPAGGSWAPPCGAHDTTSVAAGQSRDTPPASYRA